MAAPLIVGAVPGVSPAKWLRVWDQQRRGARIEAVDVAEGEVLARLDPASPEPVEVCFARLPVDDDGLHVVSLWSEVPVVVAPRDHAIKVVESVTERELEDETILDGQDGAALDLVEANVGLARMPQSVFRAASRRALVARPVTDAPETRIALVWRRGLPEDRERLVQTLVGIVRGRGANSSR
ncbi:LysR family transcriptional regulator substrate-binding protein [Homoserinibacter sp. YIM 151385]|uniref:LysR family transcriptional regulator substrate-binding protein n=1 Tax=Homoserinibacter sp. YIM 151385 TaxID=2985506 RepID=UPI0022F00110|nr:LysR family transcriptional regulator substrate-binding protein [Homoserinibacter sp. YIM 151385]WBU38360.1 LysR family transcriptional regulator substrate-binding protein [Homoserinibacter sp. YIM 151385]